MRTETFQCDRCDANALDHVGWAKLTIPDAGEIDLCARCLASFNLWLSARPKKVFPGKAKGGLARAAALTPERRQEIGKQAAQARWNGKT